MTEIVTPDPIPDRLAPATLRDVIAARTVHRTTCRALGKQNMRVLDLGGDELLAGILAAGGHHVTIVSPEPPSSVPRRGVLHVAGDPRRAVDLVGGGFDAVVCHDLLRRTPSLSELIRQVVEAASPGALLSLTGINAEALPYAAAMRDRWRELSEMLAARFTTEGRVSVVEDGVAMYADYVPTVESALVAHGGLVTHWTGLQVFTGHRVDSVAELPGDLVDLIADLEWRCCSDRPYRRAARGFHLIGRRALAVDLGLGLHTLR